MQQEAVAIPAAEEPAPGAGTAPGTAGADDYPADSSEALPLAIIPLQTAALRRARLIKNLRLDGVVEIFRDTETGSGQVEPDQLPRLFDWPEEPPHPDHQTIRQLAALNSYDVYSLRIELRRLGIAVTDVRALQLSPQKAQELAGYMTNFTKPLIRQVYGTQGGTQDAEIGDFDQLVGMFRQPNREEALRNLMRLADSLQIKLHEVPRFLEDYGDVFLSLAYFKERLDTLVPKISGFLESTRGLKNNFQLGRDRRFMSSCTFLEQRLTNIVTRLVGRFESFNQHTNDMWSNITAESFRRVRDLITAHHTTVGGALCGLSVKMALWEQRFGAVAEGHAVVRRAEFIMGEMRQGIDKIEAIEASAPSLSDLNGPG